MSSRNIAIVVVILIVLAGVGYVGAKAARKAMRESSTPTATTTTVETVSPTDTASTSATKTENLVTISSTGFSPKTITIKAGDTVTWMNSDSATHNVSSDPHPTHSVYPPLNLGMVAAGAEVSLAFPKSGTYTYHDHLTPSLKGTVVVQ